MSTSDTRADDDDILVDDAEVQFDTTAAAPPLLERLGFAARVAFWRESLLVVAVVAPLLTFVYRLYDAHLKVPFSYTGDALGTAAYTKSIIENGWYFSNPRLGAPFIADWRDFPVGGENIHWLALKVLGVVTGNWAIAVNVYFLAGFFLIALSAYFVARYLRFGVAVSLVVGVLYAFAPYHAFRGVDQIARSGYYVVPVAALVLLWAADHRNEFLVTVDGRTRWRRGRVATAVVVAVVLGASDTQNAVFLASLLALVTLFAAFRERSLRPLALFAVVSAVAMGTLLVNNVPYLLAQREHGTNDQVGNRTLFEQDAFALRPVNLVLPAPGHRIGILAQIANDSARAQVTDGETKGTSLGLVGSVGLIVSIGTVAGLALGARRRDRSSELLARLGILNLAAILIGAIGGFSFLLALAGFTKYRTWNRISLFIAFFSLIAVAVLLERGRRWMRRRARRRTPVTLLTVGVTIVLVVAGTLDQVTPRFVPNYAALAARFDEDATFYHRLEHRLPRGAMVFQLPVAVFPEMGPIADMTDYAEFAAYLHTDTLRWSYGGMKGRPDADWIRNLAGCDPRLLVAQIATAGFNTAVVDTRGYADHAASFLEAVRPLVGTPSLRSADGHLLALDLTALRVRMKAAVDPTDVRAWRDTVFGRTTTWTGFSYTEQTCDGAGRWAVRPDPSISLTNSTGRPERVRVTTGFMADPRAERITVRGPGFAETVPLTGGRGQFVRTVVLPPGTGRIRFRETGPRAQSSPYDPRTLWFAVLNPAFDRAGVPSLAAWAHSAAGGSA